MQAFLAQKSNMEPNVMCETIVTTLFDDKEDLILTVFRHVPTKYVFAVVTSYKNWNVRFRRRLHLKTGWMIHSTSAKLKQPPQR
jgi:hypothetical protein